jgi:spermidine/putrescine transport system ATP-binding protein
VTKASVEVRSVVQRYGRFVALDAVSLAIPAGEYAVLLGPSGSGKTTLLSIIGGFLLPDSGAVLIGGEDVTAIPPARRPTTTVFQDYALFPHMTVAANVGFGLRMRGVAAEPRHARVQKMLDLVGLGDAGPKKPHELSGGQRQRIALARALAVEPAVLLLDEPLGALDLKLRRQMQEELKRIQREVGTTFVHVTHDQDEAMAIADRIVVMNAGRIEDEGSPERIYLKPRTRFVADFMGRSCFLRGEVQAAGEGRVLVATELSPLDLAAGEPAKFRAGDAVLVAIRPEHFRTAPEEGAVPLGQAEIEAISFLGTHHQAQLRHSTDSAFRPTVLLPQASSAKPGDMLPLWMMRDSAVVLAAEES